MHRPHIGAEALPVVVAAEPAGPFAKPGLSATASRQPGSLAVTVINRLYERTVTVNIRATGRVSSSRLLTADSPNAVNDPTNPERVSPRPLTVDDTHPGRCTVQIPAHSMATIEFSTTAADRD
jgi:alpha-L-arabinofuranosidase